jgi:hypothetical protein
MLLLLHYFFLVFHTVFTLFNCFGWIWKKTRKAHMITMLLTFISWFFLGIWYGWGYCFCTDWHWQILYKLGKPPGSYNYIHYLIKVLTGFNLNQRLVSDVTQYVFLFLIAATVVVNLGPVLIRKIKGRG